jgi:voltage-gated potassium channel
MVKSEEVVQRLSRRRDETTLLGTALIAIFVVFFSSLIIFRLESKAPSGNIVSGVDALWWAIVTISTVGYGDIYPITNPGRVVATLVIIVGVALFSVFTSYLASTFLTQRTREQEQALKEIKVELGEIKELLKNNNRIDTLINQKETVSPHSKNAVIQLDSSVNEE